MDPRPIRGPNTDGLPQPPQQPLTRGTLACGCMGDICFQPLSACMDLLDGFFPTPSFYSVVDETSDYYTGALCYLPLFLPHDLHVIKRACMHCPIFWCFLVFGFRLALVVTYYCLISSLSLPFPIFLSGLVFSPQSWVIIRVFGSACVRSSNLFSPFPRFCFPILRVLDDKAVEERNTV